MKRRQLLVAFCVALACMSLGSLSSAQDHVVVTVSATAADDAPLMTLGKPDFAVKEAGKSRAITSLRGPEAKPADPSTSAQRVQ